MARTASRSGISLRALLEGVEVADTARPFPEITIQRICCDSRKVRPGDLYVAILGTQVDGSYYADDAVAAGSIAVMSQKALDLAEPVPVVQVSNAREAYAQISSNYFQQPSKSLKVFGVTGTNGKTTTSFLLQSILEEAFGTCGLICTVKYRTGTRNTSAPNTTPDALLVQEMLSEMCETGMSAGVLEVSSHALDQHRVTAVDFNVALVTNVTQDHLDYHGDMESYRATKGLFFERLSPGAIAVLNLDRSEFDYFQSVNSGGMVTYSPEGNSKADFFARDLKLNASGVEMIIETPAGSIPVHLKLVGKYNIENALAASAAALQCEGIHLDAVKNGLEKVMDVPGRMEKVGIQKGFAVVVDYAHTPDALANVLKGAREITKGRLICVFGCGGDRDRSKRSKMGQAAEEIADFCVVTSDNPRTEDPMQIIDDILKGMDKTLNCHVEEDRESAIQYAINMAGQDDTVLIAGKGHETYQIVKSGILPFDDRLVAARALQKRRTVSG